jgi:hypothetical protein
MTPPLRLTNGGKVIVAVRIAADMRPERSEATVENARKGCVRSWWRQTTYAIQRKVTQKSFGFPGADPLQSVGGKVAVGGA